MCIFKVHNVSQWPNLRPSPSAAWKTLVSGSVKIFHKLKVVTLSEGVK